MWYVIDYTMDIVRKSPYSKRKLEREREREIEWQKNNLIRQAK
jgi:hypothetical protein